MKKILGAMTALAMLMPGLAFASVNSSSITITSTNQGSIDNTTSAVAHTGDNFAGGSFGGDGDDGGDGGDINGGTGDNNNGGATGGMGGTGGDGGNADAGGLVTTGDANADAGTVNSLNSTDVDVDLGGEDMNSSSLAIDTDNDDVDNVITNDTRARARTGDNFAGGSFAGDGDDGGDGGDINSDGNNNNGGAMGGDAGDGGNGGEGGLGGEVETGVSTSNAGTINLLNTVLVRVRI